jgi:uncharacterized membrane protein
MPTITESKVIDHDVHTVYNQWTQFEEFPRFMEGVERVEQLDDRRLHWVANFGGSTHEWDAEITEQVPDQRISWRSTTGEENAGTVRFEPLPGDRTLVRLALGYEPQGALESTGEALGLFASHIERTMQEFKQYIEERQVADGAWRGEVHGGQRQPGATDRRPADTPRRGEQ